MFFQNAGITARRYTFYDAALVSLTFRHAGTGSARRQTATQVELHFSAATIALDGIRLEAHSLIPWDTDAQTSFRALTKPPDPQPSAHLAAGLGLLARKAAEVAPEIVKKATPIAFEGTARVISLLPGLLLAPVNGNADPAQDRDWQLYHRNHLPQPAIPPPPKSDELRLAELERALANQTLTAHEEAELIVLLGKVKGIHINSLADISDPNAIALPMRKGHVPLRNFTYLHNFAYTKRNPADRIKLRQDFGKKNGPRETFLKNLAMDSTKMARIKKLGMSEANLDRIKAGLVPIGYRVHHKLSLDDGGDNSFANLVIIKDDPYHLSVTVLQNTSMGNLAPGETRIIDWPTINDYIYPNY